MMVEMFIGTHTDITAIEQALGQFDVSHFFNRRCKIPDVQ